MKQQINEIKRMKKLAMIKENLENDDIIYDALADMNHEQLISDMLSTAEGDPSLTLIDYLKKYDTSEERQ
jgi:hypothetical protein